MNELFGWKKTVMYLILVLLTVMFLAAGGMKVSSQAQMVESFSKFDLPIWFMYIVGIAEILGAIAIWIPRLSSLSAFGLIIIMVGAFVQHMLHDAIILAVPAMLLGSLLVIVFKVGLPDLRGNIKINR